jgi:hypothetical protein
MSYKQTIIIIVTLFIACSPPTFQQVKNVSDHSVMPEKMIIIVGGFVYYPKDGGKPQGMMRTSYKVELRGKDLYYSAIKTGDNPNVERVVTPTEEQWESFWKEVDKARLWDWSKDYTNYDIHDGTMWLVDIDYNGRSIKSQGSNGYPSESNVSRPSPDGEYSKPFEVILQGVRNLLGGLDFE